MKTIGIVASVSIGAVVILGALLAPELLLPVAGAVAIAWIEKHK